MLYYNDEYHDDLSDIIQAHEWEKEDIENLPEFFELVVYETDLEPIHQFDAHAMVELIDDDRFPEEGESTWDEILKILNDNIDFDKINKLLPKLYYESNRKIIFTKTDLLNEVNL